MAALKKDLLNSDVTVHENTRIEEIVGECCMGGIGAASYTEKIGKAG